MQRSGTGNEVDIAFFADAHLAAERKDAVGLDVRVQGEVVKAAVGEAVTIIYSRSARCL